jgi:Protein of unknown function (DUF998)
LRTLGRIAVLGALIEVWAWAIATVLRPGSWRYNISDLYSSGAPRPLLVMAGEAAFAIAIAALAVGLSRALPSGDHRLVGCGLLALASLGTIAGAVTRNSCEESVPRCEGQSFVTFGDWVHGIGGLAEILGIVGAVLVLAVILTRPWARYSVATGCVVFVGVLTWEAVPYPWVGTAERVLAVVLVGWVAVIGSQLTTDQRVAGLIRTDGR